jgi:hypothetical protein
MMLLGSEPEDEDMGIVNMMLWCGDFLDSTISFLRKIRIRCPQLDAN